MGYDIKAIRSRVKNQVSKSRDPNEFRPPRVDDDEKRNFHFFVLPPIQQGDKTVEDVAAEQGMGDSFFVQTGAHYIQGKRHGCPRVINDEECPLCDYAFDLMRDIENNNSDKEFIKNEKSKIAKELLPPTYHKANIYFPKHKGTPEEMWDKVFWYDAPKTVFDMWWDCLMRDDDGGDEDEPEAFGVFFDEMSAFLFRLHVEKAGRNNDYKKSKFLASKKHAIASKNNKPDKDKIQNILDRRFNLFTKLPVVDVDTLVRITEDLSGEEVKRPSSGSGFDRDEEQEAKKSEPKKESKSSGGKSGKSSGGKKKTGGIKPNVKKQKDEPKPPKDEPEPPEDDDDPEDAPFDSNDDDDDDGISDEMPVDDDDSGDGDSDDDPGDDDPGDDGDDDDLEGEVNDILNGLNDDDD